MLPQAIAAPAPVCTNDCRKSFNVRRAGGDAGVIAPRAAGGTLLATTRKQRASIQRSVSLLAPALGRTLAPLPQTFRIRGRSSLARLRWHEEQGFAGPGVTVALVFALLALSAAWSGVWLQVVDTPVTAINIACALELFGSGSLWLAEAFLNRNRPLKPRAVGLRLTGTTQPLTAETDTHRYREHTSEVNMAP
jgi:hypothetical protein